MATAAASALDRAVPGSSSLAALLAQHRAAGVLAARLGVAPGRLPERALEATLLEPAADFLARPAKGVREALVALGWELGGGGGAPPAALGAVVELLHAGSLIVDDIEDGSTERRGGPALHRRYGVPLALNTGNCLYFWALDLLGDAAASPAMELRLRRRVTRAVLRCHYGQALDLGLRVHDVAQGDVPDLVASIAELKTGSLTALAAALGAIAAGAPPARERAVARFALRLGVGLQMLDDLANLEPGERGKQHEDLRHARVTWPWAWCARRLDAAPFAVLQSRARSVARGGASAARLAAALRRALGTTGRSSADAWLARAVTGIRSVVPGASVASVEGAIARVRARLG